MSEDSATLPVATNRFRPGAGGALAVLLVAAFLLRFFVAGSRPSLWDENQNAIRLAATISFSPDGLNLPIRGQHHPALPSYLIKASGAIFGTTRLGYRMIHLLAGLFVIVLVSRLTMQWYGPAAAFWAAALLAFNEYHVGVSSFATAKGPHLLFIALSIYAFSQFLKHPRAPSLYCATGALGLAFYCKEHSVLLLPVFAIALWRGPYRHWLRGGHVYAAGGLFLLLIAPDIIWNLRTAPSAAQATYADQLSRIGGIGLTPYPFLFFAHWTIRWAHFRVTGFVMTDEVAENPSMNELLGVLLFGLVCFRTAVAPKQDQLRAFMLVLFWFVLGFFVLIRPGTPSKGLDPVAWYWVDAILFPAVVLSAGVLARTTGRWRTILTATAVLGMILAMARTTIWWPFVGESPAS